MTWRKNGFPLTQRAHAEQLQVFQSLVAEILREAGFSFHKAYVARSRALNSENAIKSGHCERKAATYFVVDDLTAT